MKTKKSIGISLTIVVLMLLCGIFSYFKITYSFFGDNLTGLMGTMYTVNYISNYPVDSGKDEEISPDYKAINSDYVVKTVMFKITNNYRFISWNTEKDGSGTNYKPLDNFKLTSNMTLYAIWEGTSLYGDINLDGKVDKTDSELLNNYIKDNTALEGVILYNADVNLDGKIDLVDVDIIKQALLGTKGYEGLLSNKPVSIYEVYEGNINNNNNNNNGGGGSTNNGGTDKPSNKPSNNNGNNSQNTDAGSSSNITGDNNKEDLPSTDIPNKDTNEGNLNKVDNLEEDNNKKTYTWILVVGILFISLRFVVLIIKKIIKIKKNDNGDIIN